MNRAISALVSAENTRVRNDISLYPRDPLDVRSQSPDRAAAAALTGIAAGIVEAFVSPFGLVQAQFNTEADRIISHVEIHNARGFSYIASDYLEQLNYSVNNLITSALPPNLSEALIKSQSGNF